MSQEINVLSRTQVVTVDKPSGTVVVGNSGAPGPAGPPGIDGADGVDGLWEWSEESTGLVSSAYVLKPNSDVLEHLFEFYVPIPQNFDDFSFYDTYLDLNNIQFEVKQAYDDGATVYQRRLNLGESDPFLVQILREDYDPDFYDLYSEMTMDVDEWNVRIRDDQEDQDGEIHLEETWFYIHLFDDFSDSKGASVEMDFSAIDIYLHDDSGDGNSGEIELDIYNHFYVNLDGGSEHSTIEMYDDQLSVYLDTDDDASLGWLEFNNHTFFVELKEDGFPTFGHDVTFELGHEYLRFDSVFNDGGSYMSFHIDDNPSAYMLVGQSPVDEDNGTGWLIGDPLDFGNEGVRLQAQGQHVFWVTNSGSGYGIGRFEDSAAAFDTIGTPNSPSVINGEGDVLLWFDGTNFKYKTAAGTVKTITAT